MRQGLLQRVSGREENRRCVSAAGLAVAVLMAVAGPLAALSLHGQSLPAGTLDPARSAALPAPPPHVALREEYVWTAGDVTTERLDHGKFPWNRPELRTEPHLFRAHFRISTTPEAATLYLAGPRELKVWLNGRLLGERSTSVDQPINFRVFHFDAGSALKAGDNVLCVEAVRGRGVVAASGSRATQQMAYGEVLVGKLLAGRFGDDAAPALVISGDGWRSVRKAEPQAADWTTAAFDDHAWPVVARLGAVESDVDLRQWSVDAGMYGWPGYLGISEALRLLPLQATKVTHLYSGAGSLENTAALTQTKPTTPFVVVADPGSTDAEAPSLLLDFGREVAGRLYVESGSDAESRLSVAYGESELEALATGITPQQRGGNYLGTNLLEVPAHGVARGPKSAFRFVRIRFLRTGGRAVFPAIRAEVITPALTYEGSFHSSDPLLDRIWETGAYTARLCMQDDVWDAPKRDRGRWAGDLDIENRTIYDAFGNTSAMEETLSRLAAETRGEAHVNGIPSYTALWIVTLARLYAYSADTAFVRSQHRALVRLLERLEADFDPATGLMKQNVKGWGFVDWAPGLYGTTPETAEGTTLQYLRAFQDAPALLRAAGDETTARKYEAAAERLQKAARRAFLDPQTHVAGKTWQLNALAVTTEVAPRGDAAVWDAVLSRVKQDSPSDAVVSPYFNAYVLDAMSATGHPQQALDWMRTYWGGMLAEGATSFWESYDLRWQKNDFHLGLQADGTSGFFVSLAHGWSTGPVAWLDENVLGVTPTSPGYRTLRVAPRLLGLKTAGGAIPTPHGSVKVEMVDGNGFVLELPAGIDDAEVLAPAGAARVVVDGVASTGTTAHIRTAGHHAIAWQ